MLRLNAVEKTIVDALDVNYIARDYDTDIDGKRNWLGVFLYKDEPEMTWDGCWISSIENPAYFEHDKLFANIDFGKCYRVLQDGSLLLVMQVPNRESGENND